MALYKNAYLKNVVEAKQQQQQKIDSESGLKEGLVDKLEERGTTSKERCSH